MKNKLGTCSKPHPCPCVDGQLGCMGYYKKSRVRVIARIHIDWDKGTSEFKKVRQDEPCRAIFDISHY